MMVFGYGLLLLLIITFVYMIYEQRAESAEEFYPRRWWGPNRHWGLRRPYLRGLGNWRPYGYYPGYSGHWNQCPNGVWCPQTMTCNTPACQ